jgi:hypothetical protein
VIPAITWKFGIPGYDTLKYGEPIISVLIPGLSFLVALSFGASPWLATKYGRKPLMVGLLIGVTIAIVGSGLALPLYPWTDLVVILIAFAGGVLLGRLLPPKPFPFILILIVLSLLDVAQIVATSGVQAPGGNTPSSPLLYGNFIIPPPVGRFNIGIVDILLGIAMAEQWRRRKGSIALAEVPGLAGFALAIPFELLTSYHDLPLIPFLTGGWLISEGLGRFVKNATPS